MHIVMRMSKEDCAQAFGSDVLGSDQRSPAFRSFVVHAHLLLTRLDQYLAETNQTGTSGLVSRHVFGPTLDRFRVDLAHQFAAQTGDEFKEAP